MHGEACRFIKDQHVAVAMEQAFGDVSRVHCRKHPRG
jgi:hypothetical protein